MREPAPEFGYDIAARLEALVARIDAPWQEEVTALVIDEVYAHRQAGRAADVQTRIDRLAGLLKVLPDRLHAELIQLLRDIAAPRRPGQFRPFAAVTFEATGQTLQGEVVGPAPHDPPAHYVWVPGGPIVEMPTSALRHGTPMPHLTLNRASISSPRAAEVFLIEVSAQLQAGASGAERISLLGDQQRLRETLAAWHGISGDALTARLATRVYDLVVLC